MSQIEKITLGENLPLTLDRVKATVKPFDQGDRIVYRSLIGIIDRSYHLALNDNKTEQEAIYAAKDALQKFINEIVKDKKAQNKNA